MTPSAAIAFHPAMGSGMADYLHLIPIAGEERLRTAPAAWHGASYLRVSLEAEWRNRRERDRDYTYNCA